MPSTHLSLHCHLIFSTKNRYPFIEREWRGRLHAYLGGCLNTLDCIPESIGGTDDHVHILVGLKSTHRLADVLRDIKQPSSEWIHDTVKAGKFAWQEGYGAFTVSESNRDAVKAYIGEQETHHKKKRFQDEYREFLTKHRIPFDERYLW